MMHRSQLDTSLLALGMSALVLFSGCSISAFQGSSAAKKSPSEASKETDSAKSSADTAAAASDKQNDVASGEDAAANDSATLDATAKSDPDKAAFDSAAFDDKAAFDAADTCKLPAELKAYLDPKSAALTDLSALDLWGGSGTEVPAGLELAKCPWFATAKAEAGDGSLYVVAYTNLEGESFAELYPAPVTAANYGRCTAAAMKATMAEIVPGKVACIKTK